MNMNHMRRAIVFMMFFFLFIGSAQAKAHVQTYMIGFTNEDQLKAFTELETVTHTYDSLDAVSIQATEEQLREWQQTFKVDWVEEDKHVSINQTEESWGKEAVVSERSDKLNLTGKGIKVAVIDTGINKNHPALSYKAGISVMPYTDSYEDDHGHGTHVAGIIKASGEQSNMSGVAQGVDLYVAKVLDEKGDGTESDVLAGIDWALKQNVDIINLSLSSSEQKPLIAINRILKRATDNGVIVVASSGNVLNAIGQIESDILYPARFPFVVGVGSVDKHLQRAERSYIGPSLDLVAPGEKIYSTYKAKGDNVNTYATVSGTSMATAYASGVFALYKEAFPKLSANELKQVVFNNTLDLGKKGKDNDYGHGLIRSPETAFHDLTIGAWYERPVHHLIDNGWVTGFSDQTYRPDANITRGEVATLIDRTMSFNKKGTKQFTDVPATHYAASHIETLATNDIITGYPDGNFGPSDPITRADVAVMIARALDAPQESTSELSDIPADAYYAGAINRLYKKGIVTGYTDLTYKPLKQVTRSEFSAILAKSIEASLRE